MGHMDSVVVACAANATYALPLAVMLRSAADHLSPERHLEAWIVDDGLGESAKQLIADSLPPSAKLNWLQPLRRDFDGIPLWGRMPITTYDKLTIAEVLPTQVSKAIWLDCDTLVLANLGELWDMPVGNSHALAVTDSLVPTVSSRFGVSGFSEFGIDPRSPYFNAGVMVIDANKWRASKIAAGALDYLKRFRGRVVFWDQEALNAMLAGKWTEIEPRWNWSANLDRLSNNGSMSSHEQCIIHFSGNIKPWVVREATDANALYFRTLDATAWRGWRPDSTLARSILGWYGSSRLRKMIYPIEKWGMHLMWRLTQSRASTQ